MAVKRIVSTSFWTDSKVDLFSPEDKYFMLYLLTNPHTTQLGIYELSKKHAAFELGYSVESVSVLLDRFENKYEIIKYSEETKEIAIKNYLKHSIVSGGKPVYDCLMKELKQVKDENLIRYICDANENNENSTVKEFIKDVKSNPIYNILYKENENDNERNVDDSYHDSYHESLEAKSEPKEKKQKKKDDFEDVLKSYTDDPEIYGLLQDWLDVRKKKRRSADTKRAIELNLKKLDQLASKSGMSVKTYLEEIVRRGWIAFYEIKNFNNGFSNNQNQNNPEKYEQKVRDF